MTFYLEDSPFDFDEVDQQKLRESLPADLVKDAERWGASDTVVRDNVFEFFCVKYFGYESCEAYYADDRYNKIEKIDYEKIKELAKGDCEDYTV